MAIDEALLELVAHGRSPPVLHLFAFEPICLSLGRFQTLSGQPRWALSDGIDIVRRPTGGAAILHADDLCYAVVAPVDDSVVGGSLRQSYRRLALALANALARLGAQAVELGAPSGPAVPDSAACFATLGPCEVTVAGVKVVGSAQARRRRAFLQQGSLRLAADQEREALLLGETQPSLRELLGRAITYTEAAAALRGAFAEILHIDFQDAGLTPQEEDLVRTLERDRYTNPAWTWQQ